ncbi:MAG: hypothetical protein AB1942_11380 [Pseudomonadota bacterium]
MEAYSLLIMLGAILAVVAWSTIDNVINDREGVRKRRAEEISAGREGVRAAREIRSARRRA